ncbi:MAG: hypothetical protein JXJ20_14040 [Anaerolineae bacterium]|nr:hypothetical protein [Anaerolineae bacterium]
MRSEHTRRALIWVALPLIVYALAAGVITWPLVRQIDTHAAGAGYSDSYEVIRHGWWMREALLHGDNPYRQDLLAYPDGFTSYLQWAYPLRFGPTMALSFVFSPLVAFNLALLITLILNGAAAYWLGMHLGGQQPLPALLGGLVFMAFPAMQGHASVGHLGILTLWPLPLFALCMWRVVREDGGWWTVIAGGVWFALAALGMVSQIIYVLLPVVAFFGLYHLLSPRAWLVMRGAPLDEQPWLRFVAMIALGGALLLPFFGPLLTDAGRAEVRGLSETGRVAYSADVLSFASPSPFGLLEDVAPDYTRDVLGTNSAEGAAYLGLIAVLLAGIALARREPARVWLVIGLGAMLFSLGPLLKWRDDPVTFRVEDIESVIPLPWALFESLPVIDSTRTPGRFNLTTGFALSALVCTGTVVVFERVRRRAVQIGLALILGALILAEYQLFAPFLTVDARQPDYFEQLANADGVRAVLNVPVDDRLVAKTALYQQTIHRHPIIAGHVSRKTPQDPALLAVLDQAAAPDSGERLSSIRREDVPYILSSAGVDRLVVHKRAYAEPGPVVARLVSILGGPEYEDGQIAAFVVPRVPEPPPDMALALAAGPDGWSAPVNVGAFEGVFLADAGDWHLFAAGDTYGELVFRAEPYRVPRRVDVWLDDHLITSLLPDGGELRLPLWLTAGFHTLRLKAADGCTAYPFALTCWDTPPLSADCAPLDPPACISVVFEPPTWHPLDTVPVPLGVRLDHGLRLRAYDVALDTTGRVVRVRLFWRSADPLPDSYALFVHIADPESGEPLAQYDGFPAVLTDAWETGARWQSEVLVTLPDDLPAGEYAVNVGWFRPADGSRLGMVTLGTVAVE